MKKILILALILLSLSALCAIKTGKSIFYADSYMLRAQGVEAAYWNPANLVSGKYYDLWLPGVNSGFYVQNNALDLDTYNFVMSQDRLDAADKELILNKLDGSLRGSFNGNSSIFGYAFSNMSISSSLNYMGKVSLSEQYLDILLNGNTQDQYLFDKHLNDISALSYADITFAIGGFKIPFLPETMPPVRFGVSGSVLAGVGSVHTERYDGYLSSSIDSGISLHQDIKLRTALGGQGFKGMIGFAANPIPDLEVGLTMDNILGSMNWNMFTEDQNYHFEADSVYVSNLDEDFYSQTRSQQEIDSFSMNLPPELRLGVLWTSPKLSLSTDYVQGFEESMVTSSIGKLSFGARLLPVYFLPLSFGISLGNSQSPFRASYGISFKSETAEIGIAFQSFDSLIPGTKSKGVSFGSMLRLWY